MLRYATIFLTLLLTTACSSDENEADRLGVGAQCSASEECDVDNGQACLLDFKGGYCGIVDCVEDLDCPDKSACVAHDDGKNYCFRTCTDKSECNRNRDLENESNCAANITFVETQSEDLKACVPPSG